MAISNLISDELFFAIRDTVSEAINGDYDSDNIDSVDVDDEKRIMTIKLSYHAMDDYAQYKKDYFDELRYGFKGWDISPFRKMEFDKSEGLITLHFKCDKTLKKIDEE